MFFNLKTLDQSRTACMVFMSFNSRLDIVTKTDQNAFVTIADSFRNLKYSKYFPLFSSQGKVSFLFRWQWLQAWLGAELDPLKVSTDKSTQLWNETSQGLSISDSVLV